ncbi:MAG: class I SAM-dependent methyltransferase [Chloroflexi bacterium]|nr:class I SAM-dependent methyltransferase [Chloroflexota bacterium]
MTHQDALKWNGRYTTDGTHWLSSRPRQLLIDYAHLLPATGLALDAAAGVALHGLFLAKRGLHVIALDISEVGLRLAKEQAEKRGVWLETAVYDLSNPWLPPNSFDVITNFRFLERATFPIYRQALRPGGLLYFETFVKPDTPEEHPHFFLEAGELHNAFADFHIIHHAINKVKGERTCRMKTVEQLVARK